jgi:hypothetical protein
LYWCLLVAILLVFIGVYSIGAYLWLLMTILLVIILL